MALAHHIYKFIETVPEDEWIEIPAHIQEEILSMLLHLPLSHANLRSPVSTEAWATDATPSSGGATVTHLPGKLARAVYRASEYRGEHVRLDWGATDREYSDRLIGKSYDIDNLVAALDWRVRSAYSFR